MRSSASAGLILTLLFTLNAYAQFPEDALRLGQDGYGISARSMAMGNAMTGLSQGYDATFFNPAGLAQSRLSEVTMGLNFLGYNNDATYLGTGRSLSSSQTDLSDLGLVYPFPTTRGSFVIALGYDRGADFNSALGFTGFNQNSSILPTLYDNDVNYDIPFNVGLEDTNGIILINKMVGQSGKVYESGGLNHWLASGAIDIAHEFSIGLTLNLISGSYKYTRAFTETDPNGIYRGQLSDMNGAVGYGSFLLNDEVDQDLSGWNAKIGMLYRLPDERGNTIARFGMTVEFPTFITVSENYVDKGTATYLSGLVQPYTTPGGNSQYDVTTPFKFALGVSGGTSQLLLSVDMEYADWTQLEFGNSNLSSDFIAGLNSQIKQEFRATTNLRAGIEFALTDPQYSLFVPYLRVGGQMLQSPYQGDGTDQAQKFVSGGLGFRIQNSINIDFGYQYGWWSTTTQVYPSTLYRGVTYPSAGTSNEKITNTNFMFTFVYTF